MRRFTASILSALLLSAGSIPAQAHDAAAPLTQSELQAAAKVILGASIPARDNPSAMVQQLLSTAFQLRRSPLAILLLASCEPHWAMVLEPAAFLQELQRFDDSQCHGEVLHETLVQRRVLLQRMGTFTRAEAARTFAGYATHFSIIGPFGDDGDFYTGVVFPPEQRFPAPGESLDGRFGKVSSRGVKRRWDRYRVHLRDPRKPRTGCFYTLHQLTAARATACRIRLWCTGSLELFVNGQRIYRVDRAIDDPPPLHYVSARLRAGHNQVLIKSADNRVNALGLRYQDRHGRPLAGLAEWTRTPQLRAPSATSTELPLFDPPTGPVQLLLSGVQHATGNAAARLRLAAAFLPVGPRRSLELLDPVWQSPPQDPQLRLALATALRRQALLPESLRRSQARRLEEDLAAELTDHHAMTMRQLDHLLADDKQEEELRQLRRQVDADGAKPSPRTFRRLSASFGRLGLRAEQRRLRGRWRRAHPYDIEPALREARYLRSAGNITGAHKELQRIAAHHPGATRILSQQFSLLLDLGQTDRAEALLNRLDPAGVAGPDHLRRLARIARRRGDQQRYLDLQETISKHPAIDTSGLGLAADALRRGGRSTTADRIDGEILDLDPSYHDVRRCLAVAQGRAEYPNIARFRRDSSAVIRDFKLGEREAGANSSLLLDQMIVEVFADGSRVEEVHTIRRINDRSGIEQHKNASGAAAADEILLLRTLASDGKSYVPNRVADEFSMPRLTPGAMIEQEYRNFHHSPAPGPWRVSKFYFQNADAPFLLSELVLILPRVHAGSFRRRRLPAAKEIALEDGKTAFVFRVIDSPRLPTEVYPPPVEDSIPMLVYGQDDGSDSLARRFRRQAHLRSTLTPLLRRQATQLTAGLQNDTERLAAIHDFVHTVIAQGSGSSNPTAILMLKKGPRFFLEVALIKAAGIPLRHGLCASTRRALRPVAKPFYRDEIPYRIPCVLVEPRGGKPSWLFADSPRHFPLGEIAAPRLGAEVLIADPLKVSQLPRLSWQTRTGLLARGTLQVHRDGQARLELDVTFRGATGFGFAESIRNQPRNRQVLIARNLIGRLMSGWTFANAELVDLEQHQALQAHGVLTRGRALEAAGDKSLLSLPMPKSNWVRMFGGRGERTLPMRLHREMAMHWQIRVTPGPGLVFRTLPPPVKIEHPLIGFALSYSRDGDSVLVDRRFEQRPGEIAAADFAAWRTLLGQLDAAEETNLELLPKARVP